jgi:hypothetical protein
MEESWSSDFSIISLSSLSSQSSPSTASPPVHSRLPSSSARSLVASGELPAPSDDPEDPPEQAGTTPTPCFAHDASRPTSSDSHANHPSTQPGPSPALSQHSHHPLASYLLAEHSFGLSPPSSPTSSVSSFPANPRSRVPSSGALSSIASRGRTGRGRGRTGSASSTVSTDGSAHEGSGGGKDSLASGASSGGDSEHDHRGLVMPSLHLGGSSMPLGHGRAAKSSKEDIGRRASSASRVKVLVLGKAADERKTLATLLSLDDDSRQATSANSIGGGTDMSYSFFSTRRSEVSSSSGPSEPSLPSPTLPVAAGSTSASVELYQPSSPSRQDPVRTLSVLRQSLEQLEVKLSPKYPTTTGLLSLVEKAGCGDFDAAFFLYSSRAWFLSFSFSKCIDQDPPRSSDCRRNRLFTPNLAPPSSLSRSHSPALTNREAAEDGGPRASRQGTAHDGRCPVGRRLIVVV